jgi:hypothetical protein
MERRLRLAGGAALLALGVEGVSLRWSHPTAFLLFAIVGGGLLAIAILVYLYSIFTA